MPHQPNFSAQLEPQELDALRKLATQLNLTIVGGPHNGSGSPRQLLQALAHSVRANGLKYTAEAIKPLLSEE